MKIRPETKVIDLVTWPLLDALTGAELLVYLRLVAFTAKLGRRMRVRNEDLCAVGRTASRALGALADRNLIKLEYAEVDNSRTIEVYT